MCVQTHVAEPLDNEGLAGEARREAHLAHDLLVVEEHVQPEAGGKILFFYRIVIA
jgi:hypothetical protein